MDTFLVTPAEAAWMHFRGLIRGTGTRCLKLQTAPCTNPFYDEKRPVTSFAQTSRNPHYMDLPFWSKVKIHIKYNNKFTAAKRLFFWGILPIMVMFFTIFHEASDENDQYSRTNIMRVRQLKRERESAALLSEAERTERFANEAHSERDRDLLALYQRYFKDQMKEAEIARENSANRISKAA